MQNEYVEVIDTFVNLAFRYGPFFFSIWFFYAIAKWAYGNYAKVSAQSQRQSSDWERRQHWYFFIAVSLFAAALVFVSVSWWVIHQPKRYVFAGEIRYFSPSDIVASHDLYIQERTIDKSNMKVKVVSFVAVRSNPFSEGDTFDIHIVKNAGYLVGAGVKKAIADRLTLLLTYSDETHAVYMLRYNEEKDEFMLVPKNQSDNAQNES